MLDGDAGAELSVVALARSALANGHAALAADDRISALRWLERAHRLVPGDPHAILTLAGALLADDPARAVVLLRNITIKHDVRLAWLGLAAAHLRLADTAEAGSALAAVLSRHAFEPDATMLAEQIVDATDAAGWCGARSDGMLELHAPARNPLQVFLDGRKIRGSMLPADWQQGRTLDVRSDDRHLLGSPIRIAAIRRVAGCVEVSDGGIRGWAWHPGDPATAPSLSLVCLFTRREWTINARDESVAVAGAGPLARPRTFNVTREALLEAAGPEAASPFHVRGVDGKDLPGSPLNPFADEANHVAAAIRLGQIYSAGSKPGARAGSRQAVRKVQAQHSALAEISPALRADAPVPARPVGADRRLRAATIVIPVHDGGEAWLACLTSVLASTRAWVHVLVVDDASSDAALLAVLGNLVRRRKISLIRHHRKLGFPASANTGIQAAEGRDVVLLDGFTLVPPGWLERLRAAAYAAAGIGTVTPLSNDAGTLSYPGEAGTSPCPDQAATNRLDRMAERANGAAVVDIPIAAGGCVYMRRDCLDAVGLFRTDVFAQGTCEEDDLCLRARRLGWRNVALPGLFVGHRDSTQFGDTTVHLRARNGRIIGQLHPGQDALIADFIARDPLAESRRRIDLLRWREQARKWQRAIVLITHGDGGGVEQRLRHAADTHTSVGCRAIVLRPGMTAAGGPAIAVRDGVSGDFPNLVYAMPRELPALVRLLRAARPDAIQAHHLADYPAAVYDLVTQLGIPYDVHVHDYAWFCPRVSLVAATNRYCGEPDLHGCEACVADNGHFLREDIAVAALRSRSAAFLAAARCVVVPSDDAGSRMRRQFGGLTTTTIPHEDDASIPRPAAQPAARSGRQIVCVVGAIGVHKGYEVLLACARDAARRDLALEFIVVGHTIDDARMLATGRVFVTGRFEPHEAAALIAQQGARLAFLPSVCPETWCLTLGDVWRAGLAAVSFDIGAPAERIKRTGCGFVLPLGLSPGAINNALIAAIRTVGH